MGTNPKKVAKNGNSVMLRKSKNLAEGINKRYIAISLKERGSGGYSYITFEKSDFKVTAFENENGAGIMLPTIKGSEGQPVYYKDLQFKSEKGEADYYESKSKYVDRVWQFHENESTIEEDKNLSWNGSR